MSRTTCSDSDFRLSNYEYIRTVNKLKSLNVISLPVNRQIITE